MAKLQILLRGVTANSLYYVVSPQTVSTYPFTMQSYKSYYVVSPQTVPWLNQSFQFLVYKYIGLRVKNVLTFDIFKQMQLSTFGFKS